MIAVGGSGKEAPGMTQAQPKGATALVARAEWPFAALVLLALLSPPIVLAQGGTVAARRCRWP